MTGFIGATPPTKPQADRSEISYLSMSICAAFLRLVPQGLPLVAGLIVSLDDFLEHDFPQG